jgi:flagellar protein FliS
MNSPGNAGIRQYQQINTQSSLASATPHRLIQLLMERALMKMGLAKGHMEREEVREKGNNIGVAISIISVLQASLNHKANERMSANFDELYGYMMRPKPDQPRSGARALHLDGAVCQPQHRPARL